MNRRDFLGKVVIGTGVCTLARDLFLNPPKDIVSVADTMPYYIPESQYRCVADPYFAAADMNGEAQIMRTHKVHSPVFGELEYTTLPGYDESIYTSTKWVEFDHPVFGKGRISELLWIGFGGEKSLFSYVVHQDTKVVRWFAPGYENTKLNRRDQFFKGVIQKAFGNYFEWKA